MEHIANHSNISGIFIVFLVMVSSGALGGLIGFFLADPEEVPHLSWVKYVTIGIGAALVIPLFLNSISGTLIDDIIGSGGEAGAGDYRKLLLLVGFCLVASITSRKFLSSISQKVFNQLAENRKEIEEAKSEVEQAKQSASWAEKIVTPLVEEDVGEAPVTDQPTAEAIPDSLAEDQRAVLGAMVASNYSMRSLSGLARDARMAKPQANRILNDLIEHGLAKQTESRSGQPRWYATTEGRSAFNAK